MEFKKQLTDWIGYIYILVIFGFIVICNKYIYTYIFECIYIYLNVFGFGQWYQITLSTHPDILFDLCGTLEEKHQKKPMSHVFIRVYAKDVQWY
jgi:hypothetical protein